MAVHLAERPLSSDQHLTEDGDGRMHLTATVLETDELTWWLLGFGSAIQVIGTASLRQRIGQALDEAAAQYRTS